MSWNGAIAVILVWVYITLLRISYDLKSINEKLSNIKVECHVKSEEDLDEEKKD